MYLGTFHSNTGFSFRHYLRTATSAEEAKVIAFWVKMNRGRGDEYSIKLCITSITGIRNNDFMAYDKALEWLGKNKYKDKTGL
ncbi:MAG: hypothetical protein SCALA701_01430 [Candidatus Scalindua sp.]|nr:MAG: hypothetical protein SCALA701_01430 [Candidatus Scalindua sp.]